VEIAREMPGCLGARLTGAGFGGCAVALVGPAHVAQFIPETSAAYEQATGLQPSLYAVRASDGAKVGRPSCATP
ncbi:MAG: hypothetical protein FJX75_16055, partial [Armatimonadetes bacterium]|nr:hypothetical protein [Armatimonadota bacterium]